MIFNYTAMKPWYRPDGINENNIIAAYRFAGVGTEQEALKDVSGMQNSLNKVGNCQLQADGFKIINENRQGGTAPNGLNNINVAKHFQSCVIKYKKNNANDKFFVIVNTHNDRPDGKRNYHLCPETAILGAYNFWVEGQQLTNVLLYDEAYGIGFINNHKNPKTTNMHLNEAVLGWNLAENQIWVNGVLKNTVEKTRGIDNNGWMVEWFGGGPLIGMDHTTNSYQGKTVIISSAMFFNISLSNEQHINVFNNMI